ncbi:unnamed protein product [Boreogadus saida]
MGHNIPLGKYLVGFLLVVLFQEGAEDNIARYPPPKPPTTTGQVSLRPPVADMTTMENLFGGSHAVK